MTDNNNNNNSKSPTNTTDLTPTTTPSTPEIEKPTGKDVLDNVVSDGLAEMQKFGITPRLHARLLSREVGATVQHTFKALREVRTVTADGTKVVKEPYVMYSKHMVNWKVRQVARQDIGRIFGLYQADDLHRGSGDHFTFIQINAAEQAILQALTDGSPAHVVNPAESEVVENANIKTIEVDPE